MSIGPVFLKGGPALSRKRQRNRRLLYGKRLGQLFWTFFKIGPVTFGGGYAVIPVIEKEVVQRLKWIDEQEAADVLAVTQSIPGAIAINAATFVGYKRAGIPGAIAAMFGILLPTFLIVLGLSAVFLQVRDNPKIDAAFQAIKASIVALIVYAGIKIWKSAVLDKTTLAVAAAAVVFMAAAAVNPVLLIAAGAAAGICLVKAKEKLGFKVRLAREEETHEAYTDYYFGDGI